MTRFVSYSASGQPTDLDGWIAWARWTIERETVRTESGCWLYQRDPNPDGYGRLVVKALRETLAHRVAYRAYVGDISTGLTVHHKCFQTMCLNPDHLTLLTNLENARLVRKRMWTSCVRGHAFDDDNTIWVVNRRNPAGPRHRQCRACRRERDRRRRSSGRSAA